MIAELLRAEGDLAEPHALENLVTHRCPYVRPDVRLYATCTTHARAESDTLRNKRVAHYYGYFFDIGHPSYDQLTPVKTRYPLTSIQLSQVTRSFKVNR